MDYVVGLLVEFYTVDIVVWALQYGLYSMGFTVWALQYGLYSMLLTVENSLFINPSIINLV
jgi:hypothetical protein